MRLDIDYEHHPAFAPYVSNREPADAFEGIFAEVDAAIMTHVDGLDLERRELAAAQESFRRRVADDPGIEPSFKPYLIAAGDRAVDRAVDEELRRRRWGTGMATVSADTRRQAEMILEQGYCTFQMPRATLDRLREVLKPDVERLRRTAAEAPDDIITAAPSNHDAIWIVEDFCQSSGLTAAISAYFGQEYGQLGFVTHLSHPNDSWYRVFDDINLEMPMTTQMHFDLAFEVPKAMLYLNDIGEKQGPFSLLPKAEPWERFGSELAFRKHIMHAITDFVVEKHGRTAEGNTSMLRYPEARRTFASLPRTLRATSHPGDHILDGTALSGRLLASEKKLVGEAGSMPVFLGSHVLHRGGLVAEGERLALQIVFPPGPKPARPAPPPPPPKPPGLLGRIGRRLRHIRARLS